MRIEFQYHQETSSLTAERDGDRWRVVLPDGSAHTLKARRLPDGLLELDQEGKEGGADSLLRVAAARTERGLEISHDGQTYVFALPEADARSGASLARRKRVASGLLTASMPGVVAAVHVAEGQSVEAGQPLLVLEAMKVMATLEAPFAGTVANLAVHKGQQVKQNQSLLEIVAPAP